MNRFLSWLPLCLRRQRLLLPALVLSVAQLSGCATNPVTGDADFVLMSEEQEIELGKQYHQEIMKQYSEYDDPELEALVGRIGEKLSRLSHRDDLVFHFTVLDSPEVNAFALPGGYVYVTRGIIAYMNNEEELAGVLGHEIGHVTARHSVRQHRDQTLAGVAGVATAILTGSSAYADLVNLGGTALVRGYGRSHELEADRLGAEYLAKADYDPEMMLEVVSILKDQETFEIQRAREENRDPRIYHGVFSTHPENDDRLQAVVRAANQFRNPDPLRPDPEEFLGLLDGLVVGNSEDQGIVRGNRFYHRELDLTMAFPEGWRIENHPTRLLAFRPDNKAALVVQMDHLKKRETAEEYLRRQFKDIEDGRKLSEGRYTGIVQGKTPYGNGPVRVSAVFLDKNVYILSGFAEGELPDEDFIAAAESLRHLAGDEHRLAVAKRLKLIRAEPGDTFETLAWEADLGAYGAEQLRLLNGMYPNGQPETGQLIKIVR